MKAKYLPRGDSSLSEPTVRLFKPFDELVVDFQVSFIFFLQNSVGIPLFVQSLISLLDMKNYPSLRIDPLLQDFNVDTLEKSVEEASIPIVTLFNKDPSNYPFTIKFFNSPNAKVSVITLFFVIQICKKLLWLQSAYTISFKLKHWFFTVKEFLFDM